MNLSTTTTPRSADSGRRPTLMRPTERLPLLARLDAPGDPGALARLPWERADLRNPSLASAPDTSPFPEHLQTPWRLYMHPESPEKRP